MLEGSTDPSSPAPSPSAEAEQTVDTAGATPADAQGPEAQADDETAAGLGLKATTFRHEAVQVRGLHSLPTKVEHVADAAQVH